MNEGGNKIQIFEPHRSSLPPLKPYFQDFWRRREFATELSKFSDKAEYLDSKLGKVWLVLNPLFLAVIYFLQERRRSVPVSLAIVFTARSES